MQQAEYVCAVSRNFLDIVPRDEALLVTIPKFEDFFEISSQDGAVFRSAFPANGNRIIIDSLNAGCFSRVAVVIAPVGDFYPFRKSRAEFSPNFIERGHILLP